MIATVEQVGGWVALIAGLMAILGGVVSITRKASRIIDTVDLTAEKVDAVSDALEEHRRYTYGHLGPNGTTPPIYQRLADVEAIVKGWQASVPSRTENGG